jgi:two-component sensor histidine kinase
MTLDHFLQAVHPEDSGRVRAEFERCREEGGVFNVEFRVRWSDGSVHWLSDQGKVFKDDAGKPLFITGACVDITVRKHNEEMLREADEKKDQFLALLAHELRNPLAPLRNGLQVMRLAGDETTIAETRDMMERQLSHLIRLIDDLLDVSRLTENKLHVQRSRILLSDVIRNSIESARPAIEAAGHKLAVSLPAEPVYLDGDLTRLAQVFSNLLTNSAKYTERGGHVSVAARLRGTEIEISVRDDGIGIPPEAIGHIFDMFFPGRSLDRAHDRRPWHRVGPGQGNRRDAWREGACFQRRPRPRFDVHRHTAGERAANGFDPPSRREERRARGRSPQNPGCGRQPRCRRSRWQPFFGCSVTKSKRRTMALKQSSWRSGSGPTSS